MKKYRIFKLLLLPIISSQVLVNTASSSVTDDERSINKAHTLSFKRESNSLTSLTPLLESLYESVESKVVNDQRIGGLRVDLHGKSLNNARDMVIDCLQKARQLGAPSVHFICGRGKHKNSKGKRGILFKDFPKWLHHKSVASLIESHHPAVGAYEVFLKPLSSSEEINFVTCKVLKVEVIRELAEFGERQAQFILSEMHVKGDRVEKDNKLAVKWLRKSAEQGLEEGQLMLGYMYAMGMGTNYNPQEALKWYRKAGEQGSSVALRNIATMYYAGEGVPRDLKKAAQYYHEAVGLKDTVAMNMLGMMYLRGEGVKQDEAEAVRWYRQSAEAGEPHAKVNYGYMLMVGQGIERNEVEGAKWLREGAEYGLAEGQMRLGMAYEQGQGVQQDYEEACNWYLKSAAQESGTPSIDALFFLGRLYEDGRGIEKNIDLANQCFLRAAKNRHSGAQAELGHHYRFGHGFARDYIKAEKWYYAAAKQEHASAQYNLGEMYEMGQGVPQDEKKASYWIQKAAENGHTLALLRFGVISFELQEAIETNPSVKDETVSSNHHQIFPQELSREMEKGSLLEDEAFSHNRQEKSEKKIILSVPIEETYAQNTPIQQISTGQYYSSWLYDWSKKAIDWVRDYIFG